MQWKTKANIGKIAEQSLIPRGSGSVHLKKFLSDSSMEFIKLCAKYHDEVHAEFPFIYGERQLNSGLLPAFSKISDATLAEQPVYRRKKKKNILNSGRLDYWILYKSNIILVETKHGWAALDSKTIRKETLDKWNDAIKQIRNIPQSELEELNPSEKNLFKMAYMVVPFYKASNDPDKLKNIKIDRDFLVENLVENLTPNPNWFFVWQLNRKNYLEPIECDDNRFEIYPMVVILALVENN